MLIAALVVAWSSRVGDGDRLRPASSTVNTALREAADQIRRAEAFARLREMGRTGDFDELLDKDTYRR